MLTRTFLFFILMQAVAASPGGDGTREGRRGNALYRQERYAEAIEAYRAGVAAAEARGKAGVRSSLYNNLGAAHYRAGAYEQAAEAFRAALTAAEAAEGRARAAYNAGNAAFRLEDLQAAVDYYKQALLAQPDDPDAKFNYELARRRLDEQQRQQQQQQPNQDQQQNQEQQPQPQDGEQQQEQQQDPSSDPGQDQPPQEQRPASGTPENQLSPQEAERILEALQNDEERLLRQIQKMKTRPRKVEKDW